MEKCFLASLQPTIGYNEETEDTVRQTDRELDMTSGLKKITLANKKWIDPIRLQWN